MPTCTRSTYARAEGTQSVTIFISSNEGIHTITLRPSTSHLYSHKLTGSYRASALSPVPHIPARLPKLSGRSSADDDALVSSSMSADCCVLRDGGGRASKR